MANVTETIYELNGAILYSIDRTGIFPVEVHGEFEDVKNRVGKEEWHLKKLLKDGVTFRTRVIAELWQEDNGYHAITQNGKHYIF